MNFRPRPLSNATGVVIPWDSQMWHVVKATSELENNTEIQLTDGLTGMYLCPFVVLKLLKQIGGMMLF